MKVSQYFFHTVKETPSDADIESQRLLIRAGFIKKISPGIYSYLPLGLRSLRKVENIVREEMDKAGALEILMSMVQPSSMWEESGRWGMYGKELLKFKNRSEQEFCLGPTHEEVVTDIVRREVKSYRDLPFNLYQIQTKYRDEIRPRFGLLRGREFLMKDAYSFDLNKDEALKAYDLMFKTYQRIFRRCGLNFRAVQADSGAIGGSYTHEFQVLAGSGEDLIMACDSCDYASNIEITPVVTEIKPAQPTQDAIEKFETKGLKTIDHLAKFLKVDASTLVKTLFFKSGDDFVCALVRGDDDLSEVKLKMALGADGPLEMANEKEVNEISGAWPGSCGPVGLRIPVYCDHKLKALGDWVVGANEDHFHLRHVVPDRDFKVHKWVDLGQAQVGGQCPNCQPGKLEAHRGIEVGQVFYLGDKYSKSMGATYLDDKGKSHPCEMGCYGIGVSRTMQAAVEQNHDKDGMIWPLPLAPFQVHICLLDVDDEEMKGVSDKITASLEKEGIDVLVDDRPERPGVKFKDADLLGMPIRVNIGKRSYAQGGQVEIVTRQDKNMEKVTADQAPETIKKWIKEKTASFLGE